MSSRRPVTDWMHDFDHHDPRWIDDPFTLWAEMRKSGDVATTGRYGGACCPLSWDGIRRAASTPDVFSSRQVEIRDWGAAPPHFAPPITSDPPHHRAARALLSGHLSTSRVNALGAEARLDSRALVAAIASEDEVDAVGGYARRLVARTLARVLGMAADSVVSFQSLPFDGRVAFVRSAVSAARSAPNRGLVTHLVRAADRGEIPDEMQLAGHVFLLLTAGLDTTAGVISSALHHLAEDDADRTRLRDHAELMPAAVEEFLRMFTTVSTARIATRDAEVGGRPVASGERVLLAFAAANRDPSRFPDPDRVVLDRPSQPHAAFGFGIHHCAGAKLARMLIGTALDAWLAGIADFDRSDRAPLEWTSGGVRALRRLPLRLRSVVGSDAAGWSRAGAGGCVNGRQNPADGAPPAPPRPPRGRDDASHDG